MALNRVIIFGRLTKDPEFRQTTSGTSVCRFTVACDRPFANKQTGDHEADFIECTAWRNTAEFVNRYFMKGSAITVEGSLRNNNYTDNNNVKHYSYVVSAEHVGFGGKKSDGQQSGNNIQQNMSNGDALSIGDLGEFEELMPDGEPPF